jgi:hypothetical protein
MSAEFDPYYKWPGIPPQEQPPNHYRLLGLPVYTADAEVIQNAADQRMAHLRVLQVGQQSAISEQLIKAVTAAQCACFSRRSKRHTMPSFATPWPRPLGRGVTSRPGRRPRRRLVPLRRRSQRATTFLPRPARSGSESQEASRLTRSVSWASCARSCWVMLPDRLSRLGPRPAGSREKRPHAARGTGDLSAAQKSSPAHGGSRVPGRDLAALHGRSGWYPVAGQMQVWQRFFCTTLSRRGARVRVSWNPPARRLRNRLSKPFAVSPSFPIFPSARGIDIDPPWPDGYFSAGIFPGPGLLLPPRASSLCGTTL